MWGRFLAPAAVLVLVSALLYLPTAKLGYVNFDDHEYVRDNAVVNSGFSLKAAQWAFTTDHAGNWHPVTWLSHMLDISLFGAGAGSQHLVNTLLHSLNVAMLFLVLLTSTGTLWRSVFVALLFALHPLNVESVAWISERKNVLSTFFWMLSMLCYLAYTRKQGGCRYALVIFVYTLGLMSKPMLVTLPFALMLFDFWPLGRLRISLEENKRKRFVRVCVLEKAPLILLSGAFCIVTYIVQQRDFLVRSLQELPTLSRLAIAVKGYGWYLIKALWPSGLASFYPYEKAISVTGALFAAVLILSIFVLVILRSTRQPYLLTGWFWYLGTLIPVVGIVQVGLQSTADRYAYVPLIGVFMAIIWFAEEVVQRSKVPRYLGITILILVLGVLWSVTRRQISYWESSISLHRRVVEISGKHYITLTKLGAAYVEVGRYREASMAYREALRLNPYYLPARYNLVMYYLSVGNLVAAEREYLDHYRLDPKAAGRLKVFIDGMKGLSTK